MSDEAFIEDDILHYQRGSIWVFPNIVNYITYINRPITTLWQKTPITKT